VFPRVVALAFLSKIHGECEAERTAHLVGVDGGGHLIGTGDKSMSLIEGVSAAATAAERRDEPPQRLRGVINILVTAVVAIGIATVTLGLVALLVRGAVWLVRS